MVAVRVITLRYADSCSVCQTNLDAGVRASWDRDRRAVTCTSCATASTEPVTAGASAQRIADRRRATHQQQLDSSRYPRLARFVDAIQGESQTTRAWAKGAEGERRIGNRLDDLRANHIGVLHDRRKPGGRGNIDHLVAAPTGIGVVDTKHYTGLVEPRDKGGWFREDLRLYVRGRDRSALVDGVHRQMGSIRNLVDAEVPIRGVLCFVEAEWKLFARPFEIDGVLVTWLKALLDRLRADGPLDTGQRQQWTEHLDRSLRPA
jgi:hypothetical protein